MDEKLNWDQTPPFKHQMINGYHDKDSSSKPEGELDQIHLHLADQ